MNTTLRKLIWCMLAMSVLLAGAAQAATTFTLIPLDGMVSGPPGSVVGFGFTITNDMNFLEVTSSNFVPASPIGTYTDFNSLRANPIIVGPPPESPVVSENFDANAITGIGSFTINASATPGQMAIGNIVITFDLFSRSPNDPNFNPDTDLISSDNMLSAFAKVTVTQATPEPATLGLMGASLAGLLFFRRRR
jgi:PEP-CTERM motif-containing protein